MGFLSETTRKEKENIIYRKLILGHQLKHIYEELYRGKCTYTNFSSAVARFTGQQQYIEYAIKILMGKEDYLFYRGRKKPLGNKQESYWDNEDEMIFDHATYATLSFDEKVIFNKQKIFFENQK